jgi:dienelactone hydrolase
MQRALYVVAGIGLLLFLVASLWLMRAERSGGPRADLTLDNGTPATLYLPDATPRRLAFLDPPDRESRPPVVVITHGFASDRSSLRTLARRLAAAGYAVLSFDAPGHGENPRPLRLSRARPDLFYADFAAAVDFVRACAFVDGGRIAVAGHSLGAAGALDYATRDAGIDAALMISGGFTLAGPYRPANALFLVAEHEPAVIRERSLALAARLAGRSSVRAGQTYGDPAQGTGVRVATIDHANHGSVIWRAAAADEIVAWLDAAMGIERPPPRAAADPRWPAVWLCGLASCLLLPGFGQLLSRLLPVGPRIPAQAGGVALLALAAALLLPLPLLAGAALPELLPLEVGNVVACHLVVSGAAVLVWLALRGRLRARLEGQITPASVAVAAVALLAYTLLLQPLGAVFHEAALTPARGWVFVWLALALLPFSLAFESALRVGPTLPATLRCLAGRGIVIAAFYAGVRFGTTSWMVLAALPAALVVFVHMELLAVPLYAATRNRGVIALVEASWLAFVLAAILPIR